MSFAVVVEQLDAVEVPVDGPSLAVAVRAHDRYTAKLSAAVGEFDASGEWEIAGWTSVIAWLRDLGYTHADAYVFARNAGKLRRLPVTAAAWIEGRLSGGQVKTICAQVIDRHVDLFAEHEAELVPHLASLGMNETATALRVWRARADALDPGAKPDDRDNVAHLSSTLDDRGLLNATFDPEGYALAAKALGLADSGDLDVAAPLRRGQALVDAFRFFLDHQQRNAAGRNRPHLNIVINADSIGTDWLEGYDLDTGMSLSPATLERLMCDCDLHRVMTAAGAVLDYGHSVRTPPPELWNGIVIRDRGCRWKNCNRPASWCHAHHVKHHQHGGATSMTNLVLLCEKHHGMLHRRGWSAVLHPDGTLQVTQADGVVWQTRPPGATGPPPPIPLPGEDDDGMNAFERHLDEVNMLAAGRARIDELKRQLAAA